jgi:hypothetical protein
MKTRPTLTLALALASAVPVAAEVSKPLPAQGRVISAVPAILPERGRVEPVNRILSDRLDNLLPRLMRETGIDMWVVINREYVEDPVYLTLVPEPVFAARRTTMLVLYDRGEEGIERLTVSRYPLAGFYESAWEGGSNEEQWQGLGKIIAERSPEKIGINTSPNWSFGDGLTASLHAKLAETLSAFPAPEGKPSLQARLVSAERLAVRWLESRTQLELELYPQIVAIARAVIGEAFSARVITPGVTTTDDVAWYIRERYAELGVPVWFMPYVNIQRKETPYELDEPFFGARGIIQRGDVLHTDVGITYLRLSTDTQEMGYVLRPGESGAPEGLVNALRIGNRWQDLLTSQFRTGRSGNQILAAALEASRAEKILGTVYTHPVGFHGHGAGPTIGMWDNQGPTPVQGDWLLSPSTAYAIEGDVRVPVPEWDGQHVQIKLEQSAVFDGTSVRYLAGRQTRWHLVE